MKKIYIIFITALILIFFCGCGNADIKCSIDNKNEVKLEINLSIKVDNLTEDEKSDIKQNLSSLFNHINPKGYKFSREYGYKEYEITITKTAQGTSPEDAVNKLLDMMGDDSSPFSKVEGGYDSANLSDAYNITATVDLTKIVDYDYIDTLKKEQQDRITELMSTFTGTVTLDLYGNTTEFIGALDGTANTVELSLNEPIEIYSMVEIVNEENQKDYDDLKGEVADLDAQKTMYLTYVFIAAGVLLLMAIAIILIMIARKNKKTSSATNKEIAEPKAGVTQETETGEAPQDTQDKEDDAGK